MDIKTIICRCIRVIVLLFFVTTLLSCNTNGEDDCDLRFHFRYTYNMRNTDVFHNEAEKVTLYIFDFDGKYVAQHVEERDYSQEGYEMKIPCLPLGKYQFVAWAQSTKDRNRNSNFQFAELTTESSINDLSARLYRDGGIAQSHLNNLLVGGLVTSIISKSQEVTIDMLKCTNSIRILLVPTHPEVELDENDFELAITDRNGWLNYSRSIHQLDPIKYVPYYQAKLTDKSTIEKSGKNRINNAIVADFSISRLIYDLSPRLSIRQKSSDKELIDINLTWFLSHQDIGERWKKWSNQEYLDRQDHYTITFFIDGTTWLQNKIIINGWVTSLYHIELK